MAMQSQPWEPIKNSTVIEEEMVTLLLEISLVKTFQLMAERCAHIRIPSMPPPRISCIGSDDSMSDR